MKKDFLSNSKNKQINDDLELEIRVLEIIMLKCAKENLSMAQFAKKYKVAQRLLSQSEKGNFDPTVDDLKKFAEEMKVKLTIEIINPLTKKLILKIA